MRKEEGITLIALVVTIIVMLILVLVTINIAMDGGLFSNAKKASRDYKIAQIKEQIEISKMNAATDFDFKTRISSLFDNAEAADTFVNLASIKRDVENAFKDDIEKGKMRVEIETYFSKATGQIDTSNLSQEEQELYNRITDIEECYTLLEDLNIIGKYYKENTDKMTAPAEEVLAEINGLLSPNSMVTQTLEDVEAWQHPQDVNSLGDFVTAFISSIFNKYVGLTFIAFVQIGYAELTVTYTEPGYDMVQFVVFANGTNGMRTQDQMDWLYDENDGNLTLKAYIGTKSNITVPTEIDGNPVVAIDKYVLTKGEQVYITPLVDIDLYGNGTLYTLTRSNYQIFIPLANSEFGFNFDEDATFDEVAEALQLTEVDGVFYIATTQETGQLTKIIPNVSLTIPSASIEIKDRAFSGAYITSLSLPEGVVIGDRSFQSIPLKNLTIPKNASVGNYAFGGSSIEKLDIQDGAVLLSHPFEQCNELTTIRIGNVQGASNGFYEDYYVEKLILGEGLTDQPWGIYSDGLEELYLPESIIAFFVEKYDDPNYTGGSIYMHYERNGNNGLTVYAKVPSTWESSEIADNKAKAAHMADNMTNSTVTFIWEGDPGYKSPTF